MALPLSPEMIRAAYAYCHVSPPFRRWKLPDADAIRVEIITPRLHAAQCVAEGGRYTVRVAHNHVYETDMLILSVAHEICHIASDIAGEEWGHGAPFLKRAKLVCKYHGWNEEQF